MVWGLQLSLLRLQTWRRGCYLRSLPSYSMLPGQWLPAHDPGNVWPESRLRDHPWSDLQTHDPGNVWPESRLRDHPWSDLQTHDPGNVWPESRLRDHPWSDLQTQDPGNVWPESRLRDHPRSDLQTHDPGNVWPESRLRDHPRSDLQIHAKWHQIHICFMLGLYRPPKGLGTDLQPKIGQTRGYSGVGRQGGMCPLCYSPEDLKLLLNTRNNSPTRHWNQQAPGLLLIHSNR